jgi:S1-C subfamily serine protease
MLSGVLNHMNFNLPNAKPLQTLFLIVGFAVILTAVRTGAADAIVAKPGTSSPVPIETSTNADVVANSVVKVFSSVRYPDFFKPWAKQASTEITGSGVVIEGKRILTCAHMVLYASQVQILANQAGDKLPAKIEVIAPGIDLAVLKLDDEAFFDTHPPLARTQSLPEIRDMVMAYGYPEGGNSLSITKGIISRIEFALYNYPAYGLRIQIDAAINPGNSGGPAVVGDKMVGLAFSRLGGQAENIGYIIPCEEIDMFLKAIATGHYDGKPMIFDECQMLGNTALRSFLKLTNSVKGVIVNKVANPDPGYPLKKWDVITKIGDIPLDDQGMVNPGNGIRVFFKYMCQKVVQNGKVPLTVKRAGKQIQIEVPVSMDCPLLIPDLAGDYPSYFIFGPMVFSSASQQLIQGLTVGNLGASRMTILAATCSPLITRLGDDPAFAGESLVIVPSPFFPHPLVQAYASPFLEVVKTVNDIPVKNLNHLVQILRDAKEEFIRIEFYGRNKQVVIFPRAEGTAATDEILTENGIRSQGSPDTLAVWNAKPVR